MTRRGFTLIEVLVVVAIISLLIAVLMPSLASARRVARSTCCQSQMRQIGVATTIYAQMNKDYLPRSSHSALAAGSMPWGYALCPCLSQGRYRAGTGWDRLFNGLYRCPQDERRDRWSYGKSVWSELTAEETGEVFGLATGPTFPRLTDFRRPSETILYGELGGNSMGGDHIMAHFWYLGGSPEVDMRRHGSTSNYTFADGHAEARRFKLTFDLDKNIDLWKPGKAR
jgi:prepilin-type N-terminal cleavage/methylation domain-containing protein/prepilin-type processing-associated H-X9-DG protein